MAIFTHVSFDGSTRNIIKGHDSAKYAVFFINDFGDIERTLHDDILSANKYMDDMTATCSSLGFDARFIFRALMKASKADAVRYAA